VPLVGLTHALVERSVGPMAHWDMSYSIDQSPVLADTARFASVPVNKCNHFPRHFSELESEIVVLVQRSACEYELKLLEDFAPTLLDCLP